MKPIYVQIAEIVEAEILNGQFEAQQKVYSQYQLADIYTINPATAAKGLNLLVDEGTLYKKRGLGMFVSDEAHSIIQHKRRNEVLKGLVHDLVSEAGRLHIQEEELISMIRKAMKEQEGER
ncbi:GntR family transcriptional regulator [Bacillus lacus]|uniref:GntR family transcriptional regulator n=1 Tax=Metabacillus lacus TaxID=1983721 RepID=A0A7X2LYQ4_9BACI|nr:GntR family transcriptional regulator [Metabacillus lacus]MRX73820.1 GntR family transcriptional regulator [Metabacillus lacus]